MGRTMSIRRQYDKKLGGEEAKLTDDQTLRLKNIGFDFKYNMDDRNWDGKYEELKVYKSKHGNCNVGRDTKLFQWTMNLRRQYMRKQAGKRSPLTDSKVAALEQLGFDWSFSAAPLVGPWNRMFMQLKAYKEEQGNCNVPKDYNPNLNLARWVHRQRNQYRLWQRGGESNMTDEKKEKLERLGFVWCLSDTDESEVSWRQRVKELKQYRAEHGDCSVPQNYEDDPDLRSWVVSQRRNFRKLKQGKASPLTEERVKELNTLGFVWRMGDGKRGIGKGTQTGTTTEWYDCLEELKKYKEEHGDCIVPIVYPENPELGAWVAKQRKPFRQIRRGKKSNLSSKQYDKLLEIGFGANTKWYERFEELKKYKEEHGDCIVPIAYPENHELGAWVAKQRKPFWRVLNGKSSSLNAKQYGALSDIGFDDVWKERVEE